MRKKIKISKAHQKLIDELSTKTDYELAQIVSEYLASPSHRGSLMFDTALSALEERGVDYFSPRFGWSKKFNVFKILRKRYLNEFVNKDEDSLEEIFVDEFIRSSIELSGCSNLRHLLDLFGKTNPRLYASCLALKKHGIALRT